MRTMVGRFQFKDAAILLLRLIQPTERLKRATERQQRPRIAWLLSQRLHQDLKRTFSLTAPKKYRTEARFDCRKARRLSDRLAVAPNGAFQFAHACQDIRHLRQTHGHFFERVLRDVVHGLRVLDTPKLSERMNSERIGRFDIAIDAERSLAELQRSLKMPRTDRPLGRTNKRWHMIGGQFERPLVRGKRIGMTAERIKRDSQIVVPITALRFRCDGASQFLRRFIQLPGLEETTRAFHSLLSAWEVVLVFGHRCQCSPSMSFVAQNCRNSHQAWIAQRMEINTPRACSGGLGERAS